MKRLLLFLAVCTILSSCGQSNRLLSKEHPITINFWHYYHGIQEEALQQAVDTFNATWGYEKGIVVQPSSYGGVNELAQNVLASSKKKAGTLDMPHIFSCYRDWGYELWEKKMLVDFREYFSEEELAAFNPSFLEEGSFEDGVLHILPVAHSTELLFLNKSDWDKFATAIEADGNYDNVSLGDLKTWEGIIKVAETYYRWTDSQTEEINDGKAFLGIDSAANYGIVGLRQLGASLSDVFSSTDEAASLDEEIAKRVWDTFVRPYYNGSFASAGRFGSDDVKTGDLLAYVGASTSVAYFPREVITNGAEAYDIELYVGEYPVFEAGAGAAIEQGAGVCISKSDPAHQEASAIFLKWLTEKENNESFCYNAAGYYSVGVDASADSIPAERQSEYLKDEKLAENLQKVLETAFGQRESYEMFSPTPDAAMADLREFLDSWKEECRLGRAKVLSRAAEGHPYEDEISRQTGQHLFERWFFDLTSLNR